MTKRESRLKEIDQVPDSVPEEVADFAPFVRARSTSSHSASVPAVGAVSLQGQAAHWGRDTEGH